MCGIAGIVNFKNAEDKQPLLQKMIGVLQHRGPDSAGVFLDGPVGLGHARLSIIDLHTGDQPIHNEDRTVWVVFNGEIFNYPELRKELIEKGHRFYTQTDTEVIVHLYEEYGPKLCSRLNGQFAIALWDRGKKQLLLIRDRVGIRPLFYHKQEGRLVFGSEIKATFTDQRVPRRIDPQAVADVFTCWAPLDTATAFEGIQQVRPGNYAVFSENGWVQKPYWRLSFSQVNADDRPVEAWAEKLNDLLLDAARIRLRADVPVGAYLSGGIDSTYISALVRRNFNNRLSTFSVGFTNPSFSEQSFQEIAVKDLQTHHHAIHCRDTDIGDIFPRVVWHMETPVIRTAPAPLYQLAGLVRRHKFKVVLTGEGADEIFAGYNIFKEDKVRRFWAGNPDSRFRAGLLKKLYPYIFTKDNSKGAVFFIRFFQKGMQETTLPFYSHMLRWQNTAQLQTFLHPDFYPKGGHLETFFQRLQKTLPPDFMTWETLSRAQWIENKIFLSNYLLSSQGDRMTMANSIEGRYPFLDHRVIELACRIPARYRMRGLNEKYVLKKAAWKMVPRSIIQRPKQPYRAPISTAFFGKSRPAYVDTLLSDQTISRNGYFDSQKVTRLVNKCSRQGSGLLSERENMAVVGILSTQLLDHLFLKNFPDIQVKEPERIKCFRP